MAQSNSFKLFLALQNLTTFFGRHLEHYVFIIKENNSKIFIQGYLDAFPVQGNNSCVFSSAWTEWLMAVIILR